MIEIRQVQTIDGRRDVLIPGEPRIIEALGLTLLPALIDPHVHFRVPGAEHKETWETASKAAIAGGVTTVLDMPNNTPGCTTLERLQAKTKRIEEQLQRVDIPLRYKLYLGADHHHLNEIPRTKDKIAALKIYMGSSTGDLLIDDRASLDEAFRIAAENDVLVAVHAEDEQLIQLNQKKYSQRTDPAVHSLIRDNKVCAKATEMAIEMAKKHNARLYVVHVSTKDELSLIQQAKKEKLQVFAEVTPHHLFLTDREYERLGTKALVNPPLRTEVEPLWEAIHDGTIDTIATDHAPHTVEEKMSPYGKAPSGFPSIELYLALLLNAYHDKKITLQKIIELTHTRPREIFRLVPNDDVVLVDLEKTKTVDDNLQTKAKWSPYFGQTVRGWPKYTILRGKVYDVMV